MGTSFVELWKVMRKSKYSSVLAFAFSMYAVKCIKVYGLILEVQFSYATRNIHSYLRCLNTLKQILILNLRPVLSCFVYCRVIRRTSKDIDYQTELENLSLGWLLYWIGLLMMKGKHRMSRRKKIAVSCTEEWLDFGSKITGYTSECCRSVLRRLRFSEYAECSLGLSKPI
jgi:hypothetical protein